MSLFSRKNLEWFSTFTLIPEGKTTVMSQDISWECMNNVHMIRHVFVATGIDNHFWLVVSNPLKNTSQLG